MHDILEADWKRFKEIHPIARERFAQRCLQQVQYLLTDPTASAVQRFFQIRDALKAREKQRAPLFDDFRRSTATMHVAMMRSEKLITDEEMLRFSEQLRERVAIILSLGE